MYKRQYELCVSRPTVIMKRDENDRLTEPYETIYVEVPDEYSNGVMKLLNARKGQMEDMVCKEGTGHTFIQAYIPTRGIIGFEFELVNLTSGHGIFSHLFRDYGPYAGEITTRTTGTLVSMETGVSTPFAQAALGDVVFVNLPGEGDDVTAGEAFGDVESVKAVSDLVCPVTGTVCAVNEDLLDQPELLNKEPYDAWIIKVENITDTEELLDAAAYEAFCAEEG